MFALARVKKHGSAAREGIPAREIAIPHANIVNTEGGEMPGNTYLRPYAILFFRPDSISLKKKINLKGGDSLDVK